MQLDHLGSALCNRRFSAYGQVIKEISSYSSVWYKSQRLVICQVGQHPGEKHECAVDTTFAKVIWHVLLF